MPLSVQNSSHLVIKLVLPTLWSPSNTILVRFGGAEEKSAVTGVVGWESIFVWESRGRKKPNTRNCLGNIVRGRGLTRVGLSVREEYSPGKWSAPPCLISASLLGVSRTRIRPLKDFVIRTCARDLSCRHISITIFCSEEIWSWSTKSMLTTLQDRSSLSNSSHQELIRSCGSSL